MFARPHIWMLSLVLVLLASALLTARPSQGASAERRHVVRPGESLWSIAVAHYGGDPRGAIWRIEQRNGVTAGVLQPGTVLYLPP